jgi:hypothetical protein
MRSTTETKSVLHELNVKGLRYTVWFLDKTHFGMDGVVNKQNVHFWAMGNPNMFTE